MFFLSIFLRILQIIILLHIYCYFESVKIQVMSLRGRRIRYYENKIINRPLLWFPTHYEKNKKTFEIPKYEQ